MQSEGPHLYRIAATIIMALLNNIGTLIGIGVFRCSLCGDVFFVWLLLLLCARVRACVRVCVFNCYVCNGQ